MKKLISIEDQIIQATINLFLHDGFVLSVNDGEVTTVNRSTNPLLIFAAMKTTEEDYLLVHKRGESRNGWVRFIYGNGEAEVVNDYTINLEPQMAEVYKLIDEYER